MSTLQQRIQKKNPLESLHEEAYLNLHLTLSVLEAAPAKLLKNAGFTHASYNVLRILAGEGKPLRCADIRERMITRVPDVTRLIDRLLERGFVERERSETDRRVVRTSITQKGREAIKGLDLQLRDLLAQQLAGLDESELSQLSALLSKARHYLERSETEHTQTSPSS